MHSESLTQTHPVIVSRDV